MSEKQKKIRSVAIKIGLGIIAAINLFFILRGEWALLLITPIALVLTAPWRKFTAEDYAFLIWWNQK